MTPNKITIEGKEFEVNEAKYSTYNGETDLLIYIQGKRYIGKAIPNKQDKDYEVLSYKIPFSGGIRSKRENGLFYFPSTANNQTPCNERELKDCEIYTVRRLSDNEVFTVGYFTELGLIISFYEESGYMWVRMGAIGTVSLSELRQVKKCIPVFTTEQINEIKGIIKNELNNRI